MRRTKKSVFMSIVDRAYEIKNSGILSKLVEKCERHGVTPEVAKVFGTLDYFFDEFTIDNFTKFPKSWPIARYDELLQELNTAYEKGQQILNDEKGKAPLEQNEYDDLMEDMGLDKQTIYGWQVTRGKTRVRLKDGTVGTITEWHGGFVSLDGIRHAHRDDIAEIIEF